MIIREIGHFQLDNHHWLQNCIYNLDRNRCVSLQDNNSSVGLKRVAPPPPSDVADLNHVVGVHRAALLRSGHGFHPGLSRQRSTAAKETQTPVHRMAFWMQPQRTLERGEGREARGRVNGTSGGQDVAADKSYPVF